MPFSPLFGGGFPAKIDCGKKTEKNIGYPSSKLANLEDLVASLGQWVPLSDASEASEYSKPSRPAWMPPGFAVACRLRPAGGQGEISTCHEQWPPWAVSGGGGIKGRSALSPPQPGG